METPQQHVTNGLNWEMYWLTVAFFCFALAMVIFGQAGAGAEDLMSLFAEDGTALRLD